MGSNNEGRVQSSISINTRYIVRSGDIQYHRGAPLNTIPEQKQLDGGNKAKKRQSINMQEKNLTRTSDAAIPTAL